MSKVLRIGIVGCGAIGSSLADYIRRELAGKARLSAVYDTDVSKSAALLKRFRAQKLRTAASLAVLCAESDLVVEAASAAAAWDVVRAAAGARRDCMVMSAGGLISHINKVTALCRRAGTRVYIPSGAVCGIDGLKAAHAGGITKAVLTTIKNPAAFKGVAFVREKGIDLDRLTGDTLLFSGPASRAVEYFPQNINVAAVLSLAGMGAPKTVVRIIASASAKRNIHEIEIVSSAGRIFTRTENTIHPANPKTSFLAVLSAAAVLKQIVSPVRVGT